MPKEPELSEEEITLRMNAGLRRALNTPPKPLKQLIGKGERAQREKAVRKSVRSKPKSP